jgi:hypothetical protein
MLLMTFLKYFFWAACVLSLAVAIRYGERDEKRAMFIIFCGSVVTAFVALIADNDFRNIAGWFLAIDICVLIAFVSISFDSNKYWPIWVCSLQIISVLINILNLLIPNFLPAAYVMLQGFWVYPMFFSIMAGTYGSHKISKSQH